VEKLATPDVTIADMIGDLDPIKAARSGRDLADELTMHYGLLPRANRGIFAINELPDLAGKIQVGLFNILQEGDVQIKGYPVRLPLDVLLVFSANPEDYTARGKIITPLKDRIGSEIRTHYPATRHQAMAITAQEAWLARGDVFIPDFVRETVEEVAFQARTDQKIDRRSGSASGCRSRSSRTSSPMPSAGRSWRTSRPSSRASPTSTRPCPPSPASSSSSTRGSCVAPTTWPATSSARP
jgi:magnesium chelatase subunit I